MLERVRELILKYNTKKKFLNRVSYHFGRNTADYLLIKGAYELARKEFRGRLRNTGEPYFYHKLAVAVIVMEYLQVRDANLIAAALLHDLREDIIGWTEKRLVRRSNADTASLVECVTKPDKEPFGTDMHRFEKAIIAKVRTGGVRGIRLKLADRLHNMITLWGTPEKRAAKIYETLRYMLPLAVETGILWQELTLACAEQIIKGNELQRS